MRKLCLLLLIVLVQPLAGLYGQGGIEGKHRLIVIKLADSIIHAQILINEADFKPNTNSTYYWFIKETIHCNMGGYSGHLLDGDYTVFGVDNHLLVQGRFSKGLKEDLWKYWDNNGNLIRTIRWNKGRLVAPSEHNAKRKISSIFIMNQLQTIR